MSEKKMVGLVGLYDDPDALVRAAEKVRDAGYRKWDCHTPYPLHGLGKAMGLADSPIPYGTLGAGFVGACVAMLMQGWMNAVDYPVPIGGKPMFSWPAFIPIAFELFVLFAALATLGGLLALCRLGRWHSPLHDSNIMREVTSSRFAVVLEAADGKFTEESARQLLQQTGCGDIRPLFEFVEDESTP